MKKLFLFLIVFALAVTFPKHTYAGIKVLFVNDNGVFIANTDTVLKALTAAGIDYDLFNARDSLRSPTAAEMHNYPLVIWYCSTDGVGNYLWNANDTDNPDLLLYLENGGKLWLMGTDFLYDRYGSAPDVFQGGDFVYDYLGISAYNAQAYGDDGGLGVPELDPVDLPGGMPPLDTIHWIYPTAWWVDGCTPIESAFTIYVMGPESYPLKGLSSAICNHYYQTAGQKELSFFFDPALMDTHQARVNLFEWSYYIFFMPPPPGFAELPPAAVRLISGQNPANDKLECRLPESFEGARFDIGISDISGKQLLSRNNESRSAFSIDISSLSRGVYMLTVRDQKNSCFQKFVVNK